MSQAIPITYECVGGPYDGERHTLRAGETVLFVCTSKPDIPTKSLGPVVMLGRYQVTARANRSPVLMWRQSA